MAPRPAVRSWAVPGLALGGVLLGHSATYALLEPGAVAREHALRLTGHAYLGAAARLALPLTVVALAALLLGEVMRGRVEPGRWRDLAPRLVGFQTGVFAFMEVFERLASGSGAHGLGPALAVGLPVQAMLALAIAWGLRRLLWGMERAGSPVASPARLPRRASGALPRTRHTALDPVALAVSAIRAPPSAP